MVKAKEVAARVFVTLVVGGFIALAVAAAWLIYGGFWQL